MMVYVAESGVEALYSAKKNLSKYHELPLEYKGTKVERLSEGSFVEIYPSISLKAIATPGHTPDSMSFLVEDQYLFTGDSYIPGVNVISKLPGGNKMKAAESKQLLIDLSIDKDVFPGHGEVVVNQKN